MIKLRLQRQDFPDCQVNPDKRIVKRVGEYSRQGVV
jgi:hypothetical protein